MSTVRDMASRADLASDPMGRRTDEELLLLYRAEGDKDAFATLVRRFERELYSYLLRYLGRADAAEDAFQQTFLQVHLKCETFEDGRRFRPWLYTIATHQAIDFQRRSRRHRMVSLQQATSAGGEEEGGTLGQLLTGDDAPPFERLEAAEQHALVGEAVRSLPENLQAVIQLVYYQGLKYREAAESLGVPVGTVKSRLHAAMSKLQEVWQSRHANDQAD